MSYCLVITEKPTAAKRIASALAEGRVYARRNRGITYFTFLRHGKEHVVVPAAGHLFALKQKSKGWRYPVFDIGWVESFKANRQAKFTQRYVLNIKDLAQDASDHIVATDYDSEGRIIAYNILRFLCGTDTAKSMQFSTLTKSDIVKAYEDAHEGLEFDMINAGIARHFLDFYYGVNITRALTLALNKKAQLGFEILSTGRVQAPTLNLLLQKERQIRQFHSTPYWQIELHVEVRGLTITAYHTTDKFWDETEAKHIINKCQRHPANIADVARRTYKHNPPTPFNLTDLQTESYRLFGYAPDRTLNIAQTLYTQGWISYPRTSSQKLPAQIDYREILTSLAQLTPYRQLAKDLLQRTRLKPREGRRTDPAHIAIYPTHEPPRTRLKGPQGKVYDLITKRFLATFAKPAIRETLNAILIVHHEEFTVQGRRTIEDNWYRFYRPYTLVEETLLPDLKVGDSVEIKGINLISKETQPPARYTPASLIKRLQEKGLGTRATRAQIIRTLFDRNYCKGNSIEITELGETVVDVLRQYCPPIVSERLTREFEQKMEQIYAGERDKEGVIQEARAVLTTILTEFKQKEDTIGEQLASSFRQAQQTDSRVGHCPQCGHDLRIIYSKRTRRRFIGCEGYFQGVCSFSAPIPQHARIKPLKTVCKYCRYPMVLVHRTRRRPWFLCLNTNCPNKQKRRSVTVKPPRSTPLQRENSGYLA